MEAHQLDKSEAIIIVTVFIHKMYITLDWCDCLDKIYQEKEDKIWCKNNAIISKPDIINLRNSEVNLKEIQSCCAKKNHILWPKKC